MTAADNIPVAATFTPAKEVDQETAMRVTGDALAVKKPIWMLGDAEFDMLDWRDRLLEQGVVPVVPYNQATPMTRSISNIVLKIRSRFQRSG